MTGSSPCARRGGSEFGSTLIEVVVALAIMGIAFVIIVGGIGTAIIGTDIQKQQAGADAALRTAAEAVAVKTTGPIPYVPCATTYTPNTVPGFDVSVTGVSYWDPGTNEFGPTCPSPDTGLQLLTLSATPTTGRAVSPKTLQIVKRRP